MLKLALPALEGGGEWPLESGWDRVLLLLARDNPLYLSVGHYRCSLKLRTLGSGTVFGN